MINHNEYLNNKIKGRVEIFDENNNKILDTSNLILASTRFAILYNLFKDTKILATASAELENIFNIKLPSDDTLDYHPVICGFMFGHNGANISNPSILRVPSPTDSYELTSSLDDNSTNFKPVPIISISEASVGADLINTGGSFQKIDEFINNPVIENGIIKDNNNSVNIVKYFSPSNFNDETNFYCKAIDISNSEIEFNKENFEIEYIIKFNVGPYDLIGKSYNEIGLVLANCKVSNGNIIDIDKSTITLASRLTFDEISLSKQLLSSYNIKYHIYI